MGVVFSVHQEARPWPRVRMEAEKWRVKKLGLEGLSGRVEGWPRGEKAVWPLGRALRAPSGPTVMNSRALQSAGRVLSPATFSHTDAGTESADRCNQGGSCQEGQGAEGVCKVRFQ